MFALERVDCLLAGVRRLRSEEQGAKLGAGDGARTRDPLLGKQMLYR